MYLRLQIQLMRHLLFLVLLFQFQMCWAQPAAYQHYDTLYYTSGMIRPCTIESVKEAQVNYEWTNGKGKVVRSNVSTRSLDFYVNYNDGGDSLLNPQDMIRRSNEVEEKKEVIMRTDTVEVPKHHLSINPFSLAFLGINLDYMHRIGYSKKVAIHIPFRYFGYYGNETLIHTGVGINYIPYNTDRFSMYMGVSSQFFHLNRKTVVGFPITIGFVVNLNNLLTINGYAGAGPFLGNPEMWKLPLVADAHIGIGFKLGEKFKTTNTYRVQ